LELLVYLHLRVLGFLLLLARRQVFLLLLALQDYMLYLLQMLEIVEMW
jgi:hypothetical protein